MKNLEAELKAAINDRQQKVDLWKQAKKLKERKQAFIDWQEAARLVSELEAQLRK